VITLYIWQLRWRLLLVVLVMLLLYAYEPGFHLHGAAGADLDPLVTDPRGLGFTLANLSAASMLILLAGFVSTDRRRGYYRIYFSHVTRPLGFYLLRWTVAYALSLLAALAFLVIGQLLAWGELRAGFGVMIQPALFALVYGGMVAFFSVVLPKGDSFAALAAYAVTSLWEYTIAVFAEMETQPISPALRDAISLVLPPHVALRHFFEVTRVGGTAWGDVAFAGGYGVFWLVLAGLLLWSREWP